MNAYIGGFELVLMSNLILKKIIAEISLYFEINRENVLFFLVIIFTNFSPYVIQFVFQYTFITKRQHCIKIQ